MTVSDTFNFFSKMNIRKLCNASKVFSSYQLNKFRSNPWQWGKPFTISFEPTTACNLRCPECPSGLRSFSRKTGNLKKDFFRKTIDEIYKDLIYLIFYFQGEPYINPHFLEMVSYAHSKNIYTITSTNGHFLNDENARKTIKSGLDRIIISVDGTTQDVYENYRKRGDLETVIQGAKNLIGWKRKYNSKKPYVVFQFLVVKPNEHQIPDIYKLAKEIGIDEVKLKTAQIYDYKNGSPLIPDTDKYSRYKMMENGEFKLKNDLANRCWKLWHSCVITWDGIVVPCCFDKDATHRLGDLKKDRFDQIWKGEKYQVFRNAIAKGRDQIDICTNCSEGCKVWT